LQGLSDVERWALNKKLELGLAGPGDLTFSRVEETNAAATAFTTPYGQFGADFNGGYGAANPPQTPLSPGGMSTTSYGTVGFASLADTTADPGLMEKVNARRTVLFPL
jgi:hypothetical protein